MNTDLKEALDRQAAWIERVRVILPQLSDKVSLQIHRYGVNAYYATRSDLQALMSLLPGLPFKKSDPGDGDMRYIAEGMVGNVWEQVSIDCSELPPTCRTEEYEVTLKAQPERVVKRRRIVCNDPEASQPAEEVASL